MSVDWPKYFNGNTPRPQQVDCLDRMSATTADITIVQAPTGAGKSLILLGQCRHLRSTQPRASTYLVTPQRTLQDQLARGAADVRPMKGAANYNCWAHKEDPDDHRRHEGCPFYQELDLARTAPIVVHNYASILHQRRHFPQRELLCLDEGHRAAQSVGLFLELEISPRDAGRIGDGSFEALQDMADGDEDIDSKSLKKAVRRMRSMWWLYGLQRPKNDEEAEGDLWVGDPLDLEFVAVPNPRTGWVKFVPTRLTPAAHLITGLGKRVTITSATILDPKMLCAELGLGKRSVEYIEVPSDFPVEMRPIVGRFCGKMSSRFQSQVLPRVVAALRRDMQAHREEAGIVHTVSYQLADTLLRELNDPRCVRLPQGDARDATIAAFLSGDLGPGRVLVGPGLHEGIDAAGDAARWQAIVKSPYPYLGDPRIKAMLARNEGLAQRWCKWQEAITLVQMLGRINRSKDDYGVTYVYDSCVADVLSGEFCPKYVRAALKY